MNHSMASPTGPETIIEPDLPIVDAHLHLWFLSQTLLAKMPADDPMLSAMKKMARYLFDELLADVTAGHNVRATVFVECNSMYRSAGLEKMKPVGEVEFANGIGAMGASGTFGDVKICAGIVGYADLRLGEEVEEVLLAQIAAGGARYRGVRNTTTSDPDTAGVFAPLAKILPGILRDGKFRAGFKKLHPLGLSYDAIVLEPQLPDIIDLARAFPETQIILNHCGMPLGVESYTGKREERFPIWRDHMRTLAQCANVAVKLGGLATVSGFPSFNSYPPATSMQLAGEWKPYVETCIELFGAERCMFESDFPPTSATCSYAVLWNAFKRLASGCSQDEKTALFSGTATRIYRLDV